MLAFNARPRKQNLRDLTKDITHVEYIIFIRNQIILLGFFLDSMAMIGKETDSLVICPLCLRIRCVYI